MLGFDETAFRTQTASAVALRPQIEELVDQLLAQGIDNVLLVGASAPLPSSPRSREPPKTWCARSST